MNALANFAFDFLRLLFALLEIIVFCAGALCILGFIDSCRPKHRKPRSRCAGKGGAHA